MTGMIDPIDTNAPVVTGTGLIALDVVLSDDDPSRYHQWTGGTCANVLFALAFLGWRAFPIAYLKRGSAFDTIRNDCRRWGVSLDYVAVDETGSTPVIVESVGRTAGGEPFHTFSKRCPSCGAMLPGYKPLLAAQAEEILPRLSRPQVFFFDRLSRAALVLAKSCAEWGAVVMFEPSGPGSPRLFAEALEVSHIVKYSHERMGAVEELKTTRKPLLQIETCGKDGLRYRSRLPGARTNDWLMLEALDAGDVRDTAGAGDWCSAGLLHRLATGGVDGLLATNAEKLQSSLLYGQALAAWSCRFEGARGGMYAVGRDQFLRDVEGILNKLSNCVFRPESSLPVKLSSPYGFCSSCMPVG
jgi:fructokinase